MSPALALLCVAAFPTNDMSAAVQAPSPRAVIRLMADIAGCVPHAWPVAFALGVLAVGEPSIHPIRGAQTDRAPGPRRG